MLSKIASPLRGLAMTFVFSVILYSLFFILVPAAHAATVTWDGGAGGSITINNAVTLTQNNIVQQTITEILYD